MASRQGSRLPVRFGKIDALRGTSLTRPGLAESFETLHAFFLVLKGEKGIRSRPKRSCPFSPAPS